MGGGLGRWLEGNASGGSPGFQSPLTPRVRLSASSIRDTLGSAGWKHVGGRV